MPINVYVKLRYERNKIRTIFFNGLKFSEPHNTSYIFNIVQRNTQFENEINSIVKLINVERPVVFDVGANVGMITILYSLDYDIYLLEKGRFIKTDYYMILNKEGFSNEDIYAFPQEKSALLFK